MSLEDMPEAVRLTMELLHSGRAGPIAVLRYPDDTGERHAFAVVITDKCPPHEEPAILAKIAEWLRNTATGCEGRSRWLFDQREDSTDPATAQAFDAITADLDIDQVDVESVLSVTTWDTPTDADAPDPTPALVELLQLDQPPAVGHAVAEWLRSHPTEAAVVLRSLFYAVTDEAWLATATAYSAAAHDWPSPELVAATRAAPWEHHTDAARVMHPAPGGGASDD